MDLANYKAKPFTQSHMLTLAEYSKDDILRVLSLALKLKTEKKSGKAHEYLLGKTLAMIFAKSSTRTRVSFETGMFQLGGHALFLSDRDIQLGRGETIADTAKVLSRFADAIMIRSTDHNKMLELAKHASVPVINGLTDRSHPCQIMADLQTLEEAGLTLRGARIAWVGDGNNVCASFLHAAAKFGYSLAVGTPARFAPDDEDVEIARELQARIDLYETAEEAVAGADVVIADTFVSMGD